MTRLPSHAVWPIAWRLSLLLAAAMALGTQLLGSKSDLPAAVPAAAASAAAKSSPAVLGHVSVAYPAIAAHPLFDASRAPWSPPPPPAVMVRAPLPPPRPAPQPPRGYALIGLVGTSSRTTALLRGTNGRTVTLTAGQMLDGWRIRGIDHGHVRLEAQGARYDIAFPVVPLTGRPPPPFPGSVP